MRCGVPCTTRSDVRRCRSPHPGPQDGAGRLGRFLFARWGRQLDCELKQAGRASALRQPEASSIAWR